MRFPMSCSSHTHSLSQRERVRVGENASSFPSWLYSDRRFLQGMFNVKRPQPGVPAHFLRGELNVQYPL
jgi:hypothetical protein